MNGSVQEQTAAIASGDTEAFARFFRSRFDEMYADARRATGRDESFCLDVVQEAMVRVIRSIKPMATEQRLRNWLRVVVRSCAYDQLRKEIRRQRVETAAAQHVPTASADQELADRCEWLGRELASMDAADARLLLMRYRLGWTLEWIGRAVGLKPGAVDGRVGRLVAGLRRRAREKYDD